MATTKKSDELHVVALQQGNVDLRIIGDTPLMQNRMAAKVQQYLLVGGAKKTKAERAEIKHHPIDEFRNAAEIMKEGPTALGLLATAIKGAMCTAALESPGLTKTAAQRLLYIPESHVALYGTPQLDMRVVRSADMNRTPDIRSRPILPKWGAEVSIKFMTPQFTTRSVATLLANAGMLIGVGDGRIEKGKLSYGAFRIATGSPEDEAEWKDLVENHARPSQERALKDPSPYNEETEELLKFYNEELDRRDYGKSDAEANIDKAFNRMLENS